MVEFDLEQIDNILEQLKQLPRIKENVSLKARLQKERQSILSKVKVKPPPVIDIALITNQNRSRGLKQYWRYIKLIRNNFPNLTVKEIREQFTHRRQGTEVGIPDAVWQNPSP